MTKDFAMEFASCPEYVVSDVICEDAGGGWIRAYNYVVRGGIWVPVYTVCVSAERMVIASRKINAAALEIFNSGQAALDQPRAH